MTNITMTVNGKPVSGEVEGRTLLVDFLRNDLVQQIAISNNFANLYETFNTFTADYII